MQQLDRVYLDYAATTPVDPAVYRAMAPYFSWVFGNPGSLHLDGQRASAEVFKARVKIAKLLGANYGEIVFTGSATEANNLAMRGVVGKYRRQDATRRGRPRIVVSSIEHESVLETARDLEYEGVDVVYLPVSRTGFVDLKKLKVSLNDRTILVSIMYANNEIGTIQPIAEIAKTIHAYRRQKKENLGFPLFHTDAVQALQYFGCGVDELGVDFMTLSAHKIYGPKGIGVLYIRNQESRIKNQRRGTAMIHDSKFMIRPIITGGGQEQGLRSGTENVPYIIGLSKAVQLAALMRTSEARRLKSLSWYFLKALKNIYPSIVLNGASMLGARLPNNINVRFPGFSAAELLIKLDLAGIAVSAGSACSSRASAPSYVLRAVGLNENEARQSLRFTLGRGIHKAEIDRALKAIRVILKGLKDHA